jgi:hypothetical protein
MAIRKFLIVLFIAGLFLASCAPKTDFDIRGKWAYSMTASDGNTYDTGTITFSGETAKGTYLQTNIYQVEYKGEYTVSGTRLKLTGDESWQGTLTDTNAMAGTWSHADGVSGTFTARRK